MPSLSAYCLTGVSLTLDVGYLLMAAAPDLGRGVSLHSSSSKVQLLILDMGYLLTWGDPELLLFI